MLKQKAMELCEAIEAKGWANIRLHKNYQEGIRITSRTGCRAWAGKKWGNIILKSNNHLEVILHAPKGKMKSEQVASYLQLPLLLSEDNKISGVRHEKERDRDTFRIILSGEDLKDVVFRNSPLMTLIADLRRVSCL